MFHLINNSLMSKILLGHYQGIERVCMKEQLLQLVALSLASVTVMILHELPKAILYHYMNKNSYRRSNMFKIVHYIDPIGLILCITTLTGFSKPYMYRIKKRKTNLLLGITGFITLFTIFLLSITIWKNCYPMGETYTYSTIIEWTLKNFPNYFLQFMAAISINMFFVNLIPISTFDIGLIIAGKSPGKYFSLIRNDYFIKVILILTVVFRVIPSITTLLIRFLITF